MASRSKRKYESDDETPDHASFRAPGRHDETSRTDPTPETQSLYDDIRRIEEGLDMDDRLQLQNGAIPDPAPYLQPPPHSQAPTSPRSPASTTHSLTRALDDVAIEEEEPQNKKRKAMRHGPLNNLKRARAALMRKIGACQDCKARRVRCSHFDSTKFEAEYQRRKQRELGISAAPQPQGATPQQVSPPSFNAPAVGQVGSWQPSLPQLYPAGGNQLDAAQEEIDELFRDLPVPTGSSSPYYFTTDRPLRLNTSLPPSLLSPQPTPSNNDIPQMPLSPLGDCPLPMGRNIVGDIWECKHGDDDNPRPFGVCGLQFPSLDDLRRHFESAHFPYLEDIEMYKCTMIRSAGDRVKRLCGFLDDGTGPCFQCGGQRWELWRYVFVSRTPSLTSGPSVRVGSQDGSAMGGHGQRQYGQFFGSGQGQSTDFEMLFPGRYPDWFSQQGSHYSHNGKLANAFSDRCFAVNISRQGCQYGRKCRSLQSQYAAKGPFVIFISAVSLFVASLGNKEILSTTLNGMRNHVFWMSLLCVLAGLAGMWLFKHIRFRLGEGFPMTVGSVSRS